MSVDSIVNKINSFFSAMDAKVTSVIPMPAILLLCAAMSKKGLSPIRSLTNVCQALEEAGIPTGPNPDGSPNLIVAASNAIINEVYRAMAEDAVVQGAIKPGEMMIMSQGSNSGGLVVSTGSNLFATHLVGSVM